ncbi:MAG: N-acetylneuraminate synthase family protein [Anaerolineae bacterium]
MIIDRHIAPYTVLAEESIQRAVNKIVANRGTFLCAVDERGRLEGVFTNGDLLRWLANQTRPDLTRPVTAVLNRHYRFAHLTDPPHRIEALLTQVQYVPLIDARGRLVAVARRRDRRVRIGPYTLDAGAPALIIAEIGINHNGSLDLARRLVDAAVDAGADCAKFQMRGPSTLYPDGPEADDPDLAETSGTQYTLDLLRRFQLTPEEMFAAFDYCQERGILPLCTPWDLESLEALERYGMAAYKIASAGLTYHDLLEAAARTGKPLLCSTGMADEAEIRESVALLQRLGAQYVLLHCNATYPAPDREINLRFMDRLQEIGDCLVGYSGHERGIHVPIAAVARGARVIEKHLTLDRNMEGNDHRVSLLPDEFRAMVAGIRQVEQAMGSDAPRRITQGERLNRVTLARSLVAACDIQPGDVIRPEMIAVRSGGRGLQPNQREALIGRVAHRALQAGEYFYPVDLADAGVQPRAYHFRRPWGLPVRYHDFAALQARSNPDFLEFHLSFRDLELDFREFITAPLDLGLAVHSPDIFAGDHLLNLAAEDDDYRARSIAELQRVIDLTRALRPWFTRAERPTVIASLGGFTRDRLLTPEERAPLYDRVADALTRLDLEGVRLVAQTLPPYPWYFGGQLYLNLFVDPDDTAAFCERTGLGLCLDVSHSWLACNAFNWSFAAFVNTVGPHIAHVHLVDAAGLDGEGLQIGEGEVDFALLSRQLDYHAPRAPFIPEIWQGHENNGEGFWIALDRLEKWF